MIDDLIGSYNPATDERNIREILLHKLQNPNPKDNFGATIYDNQSGEWLDFEHTNPKPFIKYLKRNL